MTFLFLFSRRRKTIPSPDLEEMDYEIADEEEEEDKASKDPNIVMDEHMAAMVLTSLSCSPVSPSFPKNMIEKGRLLQF